MTEHANLAEDREQYRPLPTAAEMFGEDLGPDLTADAGHAPGKTAQLHASRRQLQEQEARADRELAQLGAVAQENADAAALDRAVALIRAGKKVPTGTRIAAMRRS